MSPLSGPRRWCRDRRGDGAPPQKARPAAGAAFIASVRGPPAPVLSFPDATLLVWPLCNRGRLSKQKSRQAGIPSWFYSSLAVVVCP